MNVWIQNAKILDTETKKVCVCDLGIKEGKISVLAPAGAVEIPSGVKVRDVKQCWVFPSFFDPHVHFRDPGEKAKESVCSGLKVAASGGFGAVACMANTHPPNDHPMVTAYLCAQAKETLVADLYPVGAVTKGLLGQELASMGALKKAGCRAFSDDGACIRHSGLFRKALLYAKTFQAPILVHAEDPLLVEGGIFHEGALTSRYGLPGRSRACEEIMVARDIALCKDTGAAIHFMHLSTKESLVHIQRAKERGLPVTAEVTPHHLFLNEKNIENAFLASEDFHTLSAFKVAPPLRTEEDQEALLEAVASGVIDCFATDHAPHTFEEKNQDLFQAPFGMIGLQVAVALTFHWVRSGKLSLSRWIEAWGAGAQIFGVEKNVLKKGARANFFIFDENKTWTFDEQVNTSRSQNSPFWEKQIQGAVVATFFKGKKVYERP